MTEKLQVNFGPILPWLVAGVTVVGYGYTMSAKLAASEQAVEDLEQTVDRDHDTLTQAVGNVSDIKEDVADLKADMRAVKDSQVEQKVMLNTILAEIKKNGP